MQQMGLEALVG